MARPIQRKIHESFLSERRKTIISTNIVMCAVGLVFSIAKISAVGLQSFPYPAMLVSLCTLCNSIYLLRGGSTQIGVAILLALLFLGMTASGYNTGAFNGATLILAPILPILAILWRSTRAGWVMMGAVVMVLGTLFIMQLQGTVPDNVHDETGLVVVRFIAVVITSLVCTWAAWTFDRYHRDLQEVNAHQASTDHLTGVANRRSMEKSVRREIARARRSGVWLSLVMADVDHFKRYNDVNGHLEGDRCLVDVANVFKECATRPADVVGRFGGEEFIMLLPETDPEGAQHVADIAREKMLARAIPYESSSPDCVSLTLGVVSIRGKQIESLEQLVKLADEALYEGKAKGRNCVVPVVIAIEAVSSPKIAATAS
jgi:diguanylate cyclase (GGDEF)-like protein